MVELSGYSQQSDGVCRRRYPGTCAPCFCEPLCTHALGYDPHTPGGSVLQKARDSLHNNTKLPDDRLATPLRLLSRRLKFKKYLWCLWWTGVVLIYLIITGWYVGLYYLLSIIQSSSSIGTV